VEEFEGSVLQDAAWIEFERDENKEALASFSETVTLFSHAARFLAGAVRAIMHY
jgi:hypothetical protein